MTSRTECSLETTSASTSGGKAPTGDLVETDTTFEKVTVANLVNEFVSDVAPIYGEQASAGFVSEPIRNRIKLTVLVALSFVFGRIWIVGSKTHAPPVCPSAIMFRGIREGRRESY